VIVYKSHEVSIVIETKIRKGQLMHLSLKYNAYKRKKL